MEIVILDVVEFKPLFCAAHVSENQQTTRLLCLGRTHDEARKNTLETFPEFDKKCLFTFNIFALLVEERYNNVRRTFCEYCSALDIPDYKHTVAWESLVMCVCDKIRTLKESMGEDNESPTSGS